MDTIVEELDEMVNHPVWSSLLVVKIIIAFIYFGLNILTPNNSQAEGALIMSVQSVYSREAQLEYKSEVDAAPASLIIEKGIKSVGLWFNEFRGTNLTLFFQDGSEFKRIHSGKKLHQS